MEMRKLQRLCVVLTLAMVVLAVAMMGLAVDRVGLLDQAKAGGAAGGGAGGAGADGPYVVKLTGDGSAASLFKRDGESLECVSVCVLGGRRLPADELRWHWQAFSEEKGK